MEYRVIYGFHDIQKNKGYRVGDAFDSKDVSKKRLKELSSYDNGLGRPLIAVEVETPVKDTPPEKNEGEEKKEEKKVVIEEMDLDQLKAYADENEIPYAPNIGRDTLIKRLTA